MPNPTRHPNETEKSDFYTCPEMTRGSYYTGVLKVSLINTRKNKLINTLEVNVSDNIGSDNEIDIPYAIRGGYYYKVRNPSKSIERKPQIMWLKDYNGDGKAQEFALFDAEACMGLQTTLIGYSSKQDRVIQYNVRLKTSEGQSSEFWVDYLFIEKPRKPGSWKFQIDYRGRGGTLDRYEIHYDKNKEEFFGTMSSTYK